MFYPPLRGRSFGAAPSVNPVDEMNPHRESTRRDPNDDREKNRLKLHSLLGIGIPRTKKERNRLREKLKKIDVRYEG